MLTDIDGIRVGHWTNTEAQTGCTVILFPEGTVASGEVRGGAPATRDFALLEPGKLVERLDAVVLSGGSAFGLDACAGVMDYLESKDVGFETTGGFVPIVVGLALYDLNVGDGSVRPNAANGRAAAKEATTAAVATGAVGAGTGATVSKWRGPDSARPGGIGGAVVRSGDVVVAALFAVNAAGDIDDGATMSEIADGTFAYPEVQPFVENTTVGVVATNATLTKLECHLVAQSAHNGFGRALVPAHSLGDGDAVIVAATGIVEAEVSLVRMLATSATELAIRSAVPR